MLDAMPSTNLKPVEEDAELDATKVGVPAIRTEGTGKGVPVTAAVVWCVCFRALRFITLDRHSETARCALWDCQRILHSGFAYFPCGLLGCNSVIVDKAYCWPTKQGMESVGSW